MLKVGSVRWRGKCPRHPRFDPGLDGRGAIRGGCERCSLLAEIHEHHSRMLAMMRQFAPPRVRPRRPQMPDAQANLFGEFDTQTGIQGEDE
jgi:hypothetical protein